MAIDKMAVGIATGSGAAVGIGAAKSIENTQSLLNSSLEQIIHGEFIWYGSDIATAVGLALSVVGIAVTLYRIRLNRRSNEPVI